MDYFVWQLVCEAVIATAYVAHVVFKLLEHSQ